MKLKIQEIRKNKFFQNLVVIIGAVILVSNFGKEIINMCTVWELGDEAGYLANTAYFLGKDWDAVRANLPYYAYGYSLFLIPVFLIANSGVELIQGAMWLNVLCVLGVYYILIYLLEKIEKSINRSMAAMIALITCQSAYLHCNALKVNCEALLTLEYCLTALLIYRAVKYKKTYQFAILGIVSAFMYATHTRMMIPIIMMFSSLVIALFFYQKQYDIKKICLKMLELFVSFIVAFVLFWVIKKSIVNTSSLLASKINTDDLTPGNLISIEYIYQRLFWLLTPANFELYFITFGAKIFYTILASAGTVIFGYVNLAKDVICNKSQEEEAVFAVKLFLTIGFLGMLIACIINGAGLRENFTYFFYSRYYEYTLIPLISFGMAFMITSKWKTKIYAVFILFNTGVGIITLNLDKYLFSEEIHKDTARIPAFSWIINKTDNYKEMILYGTMIITVILILYCLASRYKIPWIVVLTLDMYMIWSNTSIGIQMINNIHEDAKADTQIAEYIQDNQNCDVVYMIDDESFKYSKFYSRMQVLLKDIPLRVITNDQLEQIDDMEEDTYVLAYCTTTLRDFCLKDLEYVMKGTIFELWKK